MDRSKKIKELRESTGMNRREFCEYFEIPYRTVTEWERDNRHAPEYVLRLLEYYIRMEKLIKVDKKENMDERSYDYESIHSDMVYRGDICEEQSDGSAECADICFERKGR